MSATRPLESGRNAPNATASRGPPLTSFSTGSHSSEMRRRWHRRIPMNAMHRGSAQKADFGPQVSSFPFIRFKDRLHLKRTKRGSATCPTGRLVRPNPSRKSSTQKRGTEETHRGTDGRMTDRRGVESSKVAWEGRNERFSCNRDRSLKKVR